MFSPEGQVRVFLYGEPVSMRLSFDGLYALARHGMRLDPLSGNLFAFINRRATQIKRPTVVVDAVDRCQDRAQIAADRTSKTWKCFSTPSSQPPTIIWSALAFSAAAT